MASWWKFHHGSMAALIVRQRTGRLEDPILHAGVELCDAAFPGLFALGNFRIRDPRRGIPFSALQIPLPEG